VPEEREGRRRWEREQEDKREGEEEGKRGSYPFPNL